MDPDRNCMIRTPSGDEAYADANSSVELVATGLIDCGFRDFEGPYAIPAGRDAGGARQGLVADVLLRVSMCRSHQHLDTMKKRFSRLDNETHPELLAVAAAVIRTQRRKSRDTTLADARRDGTDRTPGIANPTHVPLLSAVREQSFKS